MSSNPTADAPRRGILGQHPRALAAVFVGGMIGTGIRALVAHLFPPTAGEWPWDTFAVNVIGTAALAVVLTGLPTRRRYGRLFLGTGVCGGLTTFSTLQVEALGMVRAGEVWLAAGYVVGSVVAGLLVAHLVVSLVRVVREVEEV